MISGGSSQSASPGPERLPFIDENLVAIGGDLSVSTLLKAYRAGSFPWTAHPVTWWSPEPRAVIRWQHFHPSRSLLKLLRKRPFQVTVNREFERVMQECASAPNRGGVWITPEFIKGYCDLHRAGHAHSLEVWQGSQLAGGIYGVAIGGYFAGESMFHRVDNASKTALYHLVQHLRARGYSLLDVQMPTRITLQMGAELVPRKTFLSWLREAQNRPVTFGSEPAFNGETESTNSPARE